jgi:hypothetical protein
MGALEREPGIPLVVEKRSRPEGLHGMAPPAITPVNPVGELLAMR